MTADFPEFAEFFAAVHGGRPPFPWQERLAESVAAGDWPDTIAVPTGMGKTACIDVAVWALAKDIAERGPRRTSATRIWYVVNRRLLVDVAFDHSQELARLLAAPSGRPALAAVANALGTASPLKLHGGPLHISRLRGGADLGERPPAPSAPALILATVPMFASRFLFRGYASSQSMQPVDAALAGMDSLVLLDEAHLALPLRALVEKGSECDHGEPSRVLSGPRSRVRLVAMTATADQEGRLFDLNEDDRRNADIDRRLTATKPVELVESSRSALAATLAAEAAKLLARRAGSTCVVFCNSVALARHVEQLLAKRAGTTTLLATGRMRDREADRVRALLLDPVSGARSDRSAEPRAGGDLVVVATQTL